MIEKGDPWLLSLHWGVDREGHKQALGWVAFELPKPALLEKGETQFRQDQTDEQKIRESVTQYMLLRERHGDHPVELLKYTKRSFPHSRSGGEGMAHDHHNRQVDALAAALRQAGARVHVRTK